MVLLQFAPMAPPPPSCGTAVRGRGPRALEKCTLMVLKAPGVLVIMPTVLILIQTRSTLLNITIFAFQPFSFLVIRKVADERNLKMQNKLIKYFINLVISYSLTGLFFFSFLLAIAHSIFNFNSIYLYYFLLLAATTYFSSEILRNILESKKMINQLSLYFLLWCFLKFFISAAFIYYIKTAFSGVLGIWISSLIIFIIFFFYFVKKIKLKFLMSLKLKYFEFRETINVLFFYFLIFLLFNLDIILCYFFYEKEILGIYSASSVLAKGVTVFFNF